MEKDIPNVAPNGPPGIKKHKSAKQAANGKSKVSAHGSKTTMVPNGPPVSPKYKTRLVFKGDAVKKEPRMPTMVTILEDFTGEEMDTGAPSAGSSNDHEKKFNLSARALQEAYTKAYAKVQSEKPQPLYADVVVKIPPCLGETFAAKRLVKRIMENDWVKVFPSEIPAAWQVPATNTYLFSIQNVMKIKKGEEGDHRRQCIVCAEATNKRCMCLQYHFCSEKCLKEAWGVHKIDCKSGAKPKIESAAVLTVPEFGAFMHYQAWLNNISSVDCVGIMVEPRDAWVMTYGLQAMERTCMSLAMLGRPHPIFSHI